jgi:hypothetical protein
VNAAQGGGTVQQTASRLAATAVSIEWTTVKSTAAGLRPPSRGAFLGD